MDISSLPTDSLYKFVSLSGIVAILFCIYFRWTQSQRIYNRLERLRIRIAKSTALANSLNSSLKFEETLLSSKALEILTPEVMFRFRQQNKAKLGRLETLHEVTKVQHEVVTRIHKQSENLAIISNLVLILAVVTTLTGFYFWYFRVQIYMDRMIEQQSIALPTTRP